jgi:methyltransferase (TIGR00027 family)
MQELTASRTALATSLMRAAHTRLDPHPLIDDPWGDRLVPDSVRDLLRDVALSGLDADARAAAIKSPASIVDNYLLASAAYSNVIIRTRYTEDALKAAVGRGIRQYVMIGAGFDSFALRRPDYAADVEIFEIDHPATQALKIEQIERSGAVPAKPVHFIAADLARRSVAECLADSSFRSDQPAFFSWLGVTMYLTKEANFATLRSIAACSKAGSELAFTYIDAHLLNANSESYQQLAKTVASLGEPFLSGFDPATLAVDLRGCGLTLSEDMDMQHAAARYGRDDLKNEAGPSRFSHVALARVGN